MSKSQAAVNWQKKQVSIEKSNFCNKKQEVKKKLVKKKSEGFERYLATIELFELARVSKKKIMLLDPSGNL